MTLEERITARLTELKAARDAYLIEVNKEMAGFAAAIGELERLLLPEQEEKEVTDDAQHSPSGHIDE